MAVHYVNVRGKKGGYHQNRNQEILGEVNIEH